jgi:hypothetical protein
MLKAIFDWLDSTIAGARYQKQWTGIYNRHVVPFNEREAEMSAYIGRLRRRIEVLEYDVEDLNEKLHNRRVLTKPFNEEAYFIEKKRRRFNHILKQENNFRRLDDLDRIARNMGLTLNIKIIDLQTPPRHEPIEINAGARNDS